MVTPLFPYVVEAGRPQEGYQERIEAAVSHWSRKNRWYDKYRAYYDGNQPLTFATAKFRGAFGNLFREFADNVCPKVVDAAADRLQVTGFDLGEDDAGAEVMQRVYDENALDVVIGDVSQESLLCGDGYVVVWPDPDNPMMPLFDANIAAQVCVKRNPENFRIIDWAAKAWKDETGHWRVNLYYRDHIEKFVSISGGRDSMPSKGIQYRPIIDEPVVINPYGMVPVFHFPNNSGVNLFGRSELHNVIPLQDALNKTVADMMVAMEFVAMPQRYASGIEVTYDDNGKVIPPWDIGIDRILAVGDPDAKFGQFAQADITQFTKVQNDIRAEVALITDTPVHYFTKDGAATFPSGESLKTAEAMFVAKVTDRQKRMGPEWRRAAKLAMQIATGAPYVGQIDPVWVSASPRSDRETAEIAILKKSAGVPDEQIWQELGYDQDQIAEFKSIKEENARTFGQALLGAGAGQDGGPFTNA